MKVLLLWLLAMPAAAQSESILPESDPLEITALRPAVPRMLDPQVKQHLLRLLQERQDARPESLAARDASLGGLDQMTTAQGYKLKMRYTELAFLLTEGLAGATDPQLAAELERTALQGRNEQTRAAALVALAYTRSERYLTLFQNALNDPSVAVRLAAVESLEILGTPLVHRLIDDVARSDLSPLVQAYAAEAMWRRGDVYGREMLLRLGESPDWLVRAMAVRALGRLGGSDEFRLLSRWLTREAHPSVRVELLSALLHLQKSVEKGG